MKIRVGHDIDHLCKSGWECLINEWATSIEEYLFFIELWTTYPEAQDNGDRGLGLERPKDTPSKGPLAETR